MKKKTNTGGYITVKISDSKEAQKALNGAKNLNLNSCVYYNCNYYRLEINIYFRRNTIKLIKNIF